MHFALALFSNLETPRLSNFCLFFLCKKSIKESLQEETWMHGRRHNHLEVPDSSQRSEIEVPDPILSSLNSLEERRIK